jgi:hypothetical protein
LAKRRNKLLTRDNLVKRRNKLLTRDNLVKRSNVDNLVERQNYVI